MKSVWGQKEFWLMISLFLALITISLLLCHYFSLRKVNCVKSVDRGSVIAELSLQEIKLCRTAQALRE